MNEIPRLSLKNLNHDELHQALAGVGTFYLLDHGVDKGLLKTLRDQSIDFFKRDEKQKEKISMEKSGISWRGYFPVGWEMTSGRVDQKEGIYFGENSTEDLPLHGQNLYPDENFKKIIDEYMRSLKDLGEKLLTHVAKALGLEETYFSKRFTNNPTTLFRIFNYPKHSFDDSHDEWGVREHTDMGFLTMLLQDDNKGLEVKTREGKWIAVDPIENSFVINIGDMLELWTHGIYRATPHRVKNKSLGDRLSFPYFYDPNWNATLEPIEAILLNELDLKKSNENNSSRWDGIDLSDLSGKMTYGEFVWNKVKDVFPNLAP